MLSRTRALVDTPAPPRADPAAPLRTRWGAERTRAGACGGGDWAVCFCACGYTYI
jgi:hypothetical protein